MPGTVLLLGGRERHNSPTGAIQPQIRQIIAKGRGKAVEVAEFIYVG